MRRLPHLLQVFTVSTTIMAVVAASAATMSTAVADPIATAAYSSSSVADLATLDETLAAGTLSNVRIGASSAAASAQPVGSTAQAANLAGPVLGLGASVDSVSQSAPPDHATPATATFAALTALPLLDTSAVRGSAQARYASATTCLASGVASSAATTSTAQVVAGAGLSPSLTGGSVQGDVADVGAISSTGTTSLVNLGTGVGDSRAVQSQTTATVSSLDLLDNAIGVSIVGTPTLTAQATGTIATSHATYVAPDVMVSVRGAAPVSLNAVGSLPITIDTRVAGTGTVADVTLTLGTISGVVNTGTSVSAAASVLTADVSLTNYVLGVGTPVATVALDLAPMTVAASGPSDGVQCTPAPGAPTITSPANGATVTTNEPPISGTGTTGDTVTVTDANGNPVCGPTPVTGGMWSCTPTAGLPNGSNTVTATDTGIGGSTASAPVTFTVDAATPAAPVISTPANGDVINNATVAFTGTGIPTDTVTVFEGPTALCSSLVDATGAWHCSPTRPLTIGSHTVDATQTDPVNHLESSESNIVTFTTTVVGTQYTPLTPYRVLDTRAVSQVGPVTGPVTGGHSVVLSKQQLGLNNNSVSAVVLNLTVTQPAAPGYATAYPSDQTKPVVSSTNYAKGQTRANLVVIPVASDGSVTIYTSQSTQLVADVFGYFASTLETTPGGLFHAITPARLLDTRVTKNPLTSGATRTLAVAGHGGVPVIGASAAVLNVTVAEPTGQGYVSAYPTGAAFRQGTSNINFVPGDLASARVIVPLGIGGDVSFYNRVGTTPLVVDVVGYLTAVGAADATGAHFVAVDPARKIDSRGAGLGTRGAPLARNETRILQLTGTATVPTAGTVAVAANLTAVDATHSGYLTQFKTGIVKPLVSDVNFTANEVVPNLVISGVDASGRSSIYNSSNPVTNFFEDITGYFTTAAG